MYTICIFVSLHVHDMYVHVMWYTYCNIHVCTMYMYLYIRSLFLCMIFNETQVHNTYGTKFARNIISQNDILALV